MKNTMKKMIALSMTMLMMSLSMTAIAEEIVAEPAAVPEVEVTVTPEVTPEPEATPAPEVTPEPETESAPEATPVPETESEPEAVTEEPAVQETEVEVEVVVEATAEPTAEPVAFTGKAKIYLATEGELYYGDTVALRVEIENANLAYGIRWEYNDGNGWKTVKNETGKKYEFEITEQNAEYEYRVVLVPAE